MSRVKRGFKARRRRNRILRATNGFRGSRNNLIRNAKNALFKALSYAYRDRRTKKRTFRRLWVARINAATRMHGMRYSEFINKLKKADIALDRKVLADLAVTDAAGFGRLIETVRS